MQTITLYRQRYYTDAYGREQREAVSARVPMARYRSLTAGLSPQDLTTRPEYLTAHGNTVLMIHAIHQRDHRAARMYRDHALAETAHPAALARLWNLATMPAPKLPGRKEHATAS